MLVDTEAHPRRTVNANGILYGVLPFHFTIAHYQRETVLNVRNRIRLKVSFVFLCRPPL